MLIDALLYDGKSSKEHEVVVEFTFGRRVLIASHQIDVALDEVKIESRLGNTPRVLNFPNGVRCKSQDNDKIDQLLRDFDISKSKAYRIESSWALSLGAVLITIGFVWFMLTGGASYTANAIATILPQSTLDEVSAMTLSKLEESYLDDSNLSEETRGILQEHFDRLTHGEKRYHLHFHSAPEMGANAFALPSGDVVLTDELVALSRDSEYRDILGVLAHEKGHVVHKHSLRMAIKTGIAGVIIGYVTGDISVIATSIPTILINSSYSREFEHEADVYAVEALREMNVSTIYIAELFESLAKEHHELDQNSTLIGLVSSHPLTSERIDFFNSNAE